MSVSTPVKLSLLFVFLIAVAGIVLAVAFNGPDETRKYRAQLIGGKTGDINAEQLSAEPHRVVPEMLSTVYLAFGETDEATIYDKLAEVSAHDALETLYLERLGAMVGGGLDKADQTLHEMELKGLTSKRAGTTFTMNVKWRVVGTVGHATHLHVRGNTYSANLTIEPVNDAWRMTAFDLTDVDRTDAGTRVAAE